MCEKGMIFLFGNEKGYIPVASETRHVVRDQPPRPRSSSSCNVLDSSSSFSLSTTTTTSPARAYSSRATTSIHKTPLSSSSSSRWSGVSSFNLSQTRTMALDGKKIQVKNPVVELDGDEV